MSAPTKAAHNRAMHAHEKKRVQTADLANMLDAIDARIARAFRELSAQINSRPVPTSQATPVSLETGADLLATRHEILLTLITSKSAQQFFEDLLGTGAPPTLAQVNREIDRRLALR